MSFFLLLFIVYSLTLQSASTLSNVPQNAIDAFKLSLDCPALQASDPGYINLTKIDNGRISATPLLIVEAETLGDIQKSISFSQQYNISFSVLGGGHSAAGYCLNNGGLVLSMKKWLNVTLHNETDTITVQGGALWMHVYEVLNNTNYFIVGGACSTVGVSGFTQGGGMSWLSRSYGLAIDSLLSVSLVVANGTLVTVGVDSVDPSDQDLFWAIRGGGGGNWGVITELTFILHPLSSPTFLSAQICWDASLPSVNNIYSYYPQFLQYAPNELAVYASFVYMNGSLHFCLTPVYNGDYQVGLVMIKSLLNLSPTSATFLNSSFVEMEAIDGGRTAVGDRKAYIKSGYFENIPTVDIFTSVHQMMAQSPSQSTMFLFIHLGGAISQYGVNDTAYYHRSAQFDWEIKAVWEDVNDQDVNIQFALDVASKISLWGQGAYINYIDPYLNDWQTQYYGIHYPTLVQIKSEWDPLNFFTFNQSIGK